MSLFAILLFCAVCALGTALASGAFAGLAWLWVLPLGFVGAFLTVAVLIFLVVLVMAWCVDMKKPRQQDSPFYRWVTQRVIGIVIPLLRLRIHRKGMQKAPKTNRVMLVCNHIFDIDPAVLLHCFPRYKLAFISKRENEKKFVIGPFLHQLLCQSLNRENDREALKTILSCIDILKQDKASIGVFPEGYVSQDRKLRPFRSGVFKIAQRTNVPIVVCTVRNTHQFATNAPRLKPTDIHMHLVGVLQPEDYAGLCTVEISNRVYNMMAKDLGPDLVWQPEESGDFEK